MTQATTAIDLTTRLSFARMDDEARSVLQKICPDLEPALDDVLTRFYTHIRSFPTTSDMIKSDEMQASLSEKQAAHWKRLFTGSFDEDFLNYASSVGSAHVRAGLSPEWYLLSYSNVMDEFNRILVKKYRRKPDFLTKALSVVQKAILLDMEISTTTYQTNLEEKHRSSMNAIAEQFDNSVQEMTAHLAASATQLKDTAEIMTEAARDTTDRSLSVASASDLATANVETVAAAAEELSVSISEIGDQVTNGASLSNAAVKQADTTNAEIQQLANAARAIGDVANIIRDIAAQTNLLALNATIEAARAGEAGKGFAVVAGEVKALANQTASATEDISNEIGSIQSAVDRAVTSMSEIGGTISQLDEISAGIAAAVEEQGAATQEIARNVQEAASGTQEVASHISRVRDAAGNTGTAASQVFESSDDLAKHAEAMNAEVAKFLTTLRQN